MYWIMLFQLGFLFLATFVAVYMIKYHRAIDELGRYVAEKSIPLLGKIYRSNFHLWRGGPFRQKLKYYAALMALGDDGLTQRLQRMEYLYNMQGYGVAAGALVFVVATLLNYLFTA